jgi:hypothetical protein
MGRFDKTKSTSAYWHFAVLSVTWRLDYPAMLLLPSTVLWRYHYLPPMESCIQKLRRVPTAALLVDLCAAKRYNNR